MNASYKKAINDGFRDKTPETDITNLKITGNIPAWLSGSLLRNGPGAFDLEKQSLRHWFDGLAMLHRFTFNKGNVSYRNRFLQSKAVDAALQDGKISYSEFATDPCKGMFKKVTSVFDQKITDSAKVNITRFDDHFMALGETPLQIEFDPMLLQKITEFVYEPNTMQHVTTVHPHFDQKDGNLYNLVTRFSRVSEYRIMQIGKDGKEKIAARHKVTYPAYIHSWGLSPNYFILVEFPLKVYPLKLLFQAKPYIENFKWKPQQGAKFYIFRRSDGELVNTFETEAFFAFHHVNAFEVGDEIVCDINTYPDNEIINHFYLEKIREGQETLPYGNIDRFRMNLTDKTIKREKILDECIELARFDYDNLNMNPAYSCIYGVSINRANPAAFYNQIIKHDIAKNETRFWYDPSCYPGEPVFVKAPDARKEDDGVILSVVLNAQDGQSFVLILDAAGFNEIARVEVPHPIMFGYHGAFYDDVV